GNAGPAENAARPGITSPSGNAGRSGNAGPAENAARPGNTSPSGSTGPSGNTGTSECAAPSEGGQGHPAAAGAQVTGDRAAGRDDGPYQVIAGGLGEQAAGRADQADRAGHHVVAADDRGGDARV